MSDLAKPAHWPCASSVSQLDTLTALPHGESTVLWMKLDEAEA